MYLCIHIVGIWNQLFFWVNPIPCSFCEHRPFLSFSLQSSVVQGSPVDSIVTRGAFVKVQWQEQAWLQWWYDPWVLPIGGCKKPGYTRPFLSQTPQEWLEKTQLPFRVSEDGRNCWSVFWRLMVLERTAFLEIHVNPAIQLHWSRRFLGDS